MARRRTLSASSKAQTASPATSTRAMRISALAGQIFRIEHLFRRFHARAENRANHFMPPYAQHFWIEFERIALPRLDLGNGFDSEARRREMVEGHVRVLSMLAERHHHWQLALTHDVVGLANVADAIYDDADMLHTHTPRPVAICNVMAGVMVQLGTEKAGATLAGSCAIPAEAHHVDQKILKLGTIFRRDHHDVAGTALI